jgi:hypothetical protein
MPPEIVDPVIERSFEKAGAGRKTQQPENVPLYRVVGDSKIPVSRAAGELWASRKEQGLHGRSDMEANWDEAIRYYDNDQTQYRTQEEARAGNRASRRLNNAWSETENVVFANCSIMVPMLYAKNPHVEFTSETDQGKERAKCLERLLNKLLSQKNAPGLNFKGIARRMVLTALLTNAAIVKIGWTKKVDSSEEAIAELQQLSVELEEAKTKKEILEVEGKIKALEERISLLSPSGPWARNLLPHRLVADPTGTKPDFSDSGWLMEWDYLPTEYINAVYATKHGEEFRSTYEPTHILKAGTTTQSVDDTVNNFSLLNQDKMDAASHGYSNVRAFQAAQYTKVWYVWDKTTRRVLMFADNNWKWPLWVWDDPLRLPRFFPYFRLWFHEAVNSQSPKGEVSYYLDQQDAINEIADEIRRGRQWAKRNVLYNKNSIAQEDVEQVLRGDDGTARGVDIPEGTKLQDHIFSFVPPALNMPEFFNPETKFAAINRITGINDAMRGAQFKTNTTNKAVDAYQQNTDIRVDERTDLIEDVIGDIAWNIACLCMMNWEANDIAPIVGPELAQAWVKVNDPREFETQFNARVEGGSIAKPNSREKKQQALELAQIMGQFANAAPAIIIVMMKMIENAFDEVVIDDADWQMIMQTMMASLQKAGGGPGEGGNPEEQGPTPPASDEELMAQVKERIAQLPTAAQAKLQEMVQSGMPPAEALEQIEAELQPQA